MKKKIDESSQNKWLLLDTNQRILFSSEHIAEVIEEGRKYRSGEVSISKDLASWICLF